MTTGLAGSLFCCYMPLLLAGLKVQRINLPTANGPLATAKAVGYFLLAFTGSGLSH